MTDIAIPPWAPRDNKPLEPDSDGVIWEMVFTDDPVLEEEEQRK
jgi:hypothetical protein